MSGNPRSPFDDFDRAATDRSYHVVLRVLLGENKGILTAGSFIDEADFN